MAKPKGLVEISVDRCKGCELCTDACPIGIIQMDGSVINAKGYQPAAIKDMDGCIACCYCALVCPDVAISVKRIDS